MSVIKKDNALELTSQKIRALVSKGEISFPEDYKVENALKSAWLTIQQTQDRNRTPALQVCTPASVMNAMFDTALQGLNPAKKQCYYIVYGNKLLMQRSYFGTAGVVQRILNPKSISAQCIYEGDDVDYEIVNGVTRVTKHKQSFNNLDKKIIGAYCTIVLQDGTPYSVVMTMEEIKQSWKQSIIKPIDDKGNIKPDSTHGKFPQEMAKRTVINRTCKLLVNTTHDKNLPANNAVIESFNRTTENEYDNGNDVIDIDPVVEENANKEVFAPVLDKTEKKVNVEEVEEKQASKTTLLIVNNMKNKYFDSGQLSEEDFEGILDLHYDGRTLEQLTDSEAKEIINHISEIVK